MQSEETTDTFSLESRDCAYLIGRGGETRARLEKFSGATFSVDNNVLKITGNPGQRDRAKIATDIVLMQRTGENNTMDVDFLKMRERPDVSTLDIPCMRIGFLLGKKASSLRKIEAKHGVWAVLDQTEIKHQFGPCKRLHVIGELQHRNDCLSEIYEIVHEKYSELLPSKPTGQTSPPQENYGRDPRYDGYYSADDRRSNYNYGRDPWDEPPQIPGYDMYDPPRRLNRDFYSSYDYWRDGPPPPRYYDEPPSRYHDAPQPRYHEAPPRYYDAPPPRYHDAPPPWRWRDEPRRWQNVPPRRRNEGPPRYRDLSPGRERAPHDRQRDRDLSPGRERAPQERQRDRDLSPGRDRAQLEHDKQWEHHPQDDHDERAIEEEEIKTVLDGDDDEATE